MRSTSSMDCLRLEQQDRRIYHSWRMPTVGPFPTRLKPQPAYVWTADDDEVECNAVIVRIGSDGPALEAAGMTAEPLLASVYWPNRIY